MVEIIEQETNTLFIEVSGSGLPEIDGLFVPSKAAPTKSESGILSSIGYWNGKMAWDRADGASARSPSLSYSNTYRSWRISRLDGHLAYEITCEDHFRRLTVSGMSIKRVWHPHQRWCFITLIPENHVQNPTLSLF